MATARHVPSFTEEEQFQAQGYRYVAGVDEVGRGALAGPVFAAAVILPRGFRAPWLKLVRDSKLLTPQRRAELFPHIQWGAVAVGVGSADCATIDEIGIAPATRLAMKRAVEALDPPADALLIDYFTLREVGLPQKGVVDGDTLCYSIACASIMAKVTRDRLMADLDHEYPGYLFARHKGYGTEEHVECLRRLGPSPVHRRNFAPVRESLDLSEGDG